MAESSWPKQETQKQNNETKGTPVNSQERHQKYWKVMIFSCRHQDLATGRLQQP